MSAFSAQIEANISNFTKNLDKANHDINKFQDNVSAKLDKVGDSFIKVGKSLSIFSGVVAGVVTGLSALATSTAQTAKDLGSLSVITGASTDTLQEYALITAKATVPTDTLATATLNLQRKLRDTSEEGAGASKVLREMGVSFKNLDGSVKSSSQITEEAIKAFAKLEDGIEKSSKGTLVFGGQWQNIAQIADLGADAIDNLKQEAHDLGLVMSEDAIDKSADFGIALDVLKLRVTALKNQIGMSLAPMLTDTLLPIIENQIMPAVKRFADFIKNLIDRFNELSPATKTLIASITGIAIALGPTLVALGGLLKLLPLIGAGFTALTGPVGIAVIGITAGAIAVVKNWDKVVDYFTYGQGADTFQAILRDVIAFKDSVITVFTEIKKTVTHLWSSMGSELEDESETFLQTINRGLNNTLNLWRNLWIDFKKARASETLGEEFSNIGKMFSNFGKGLLVDVVEPIDKVGVVVKELTQAQQDAMDAGNKWGLSLNNSAEGLTEVNPELDALNKEIERLKKNLNNISTESIIPQGSLKELSEKLKVLYEQLDNETTQSGRIKVSRLINELENKVVRIKVAIDFENALKPISNTDLGVSPIIDLSPQIDKMGSDLDRMKAVFDEKNQEIAQTVQALNGIVVGGFTGMFSALGDALGSGSSLLDSLGNALLGGIGSMAVQLGQLAIGIGVAIEGIKKALQSLNPVVAVAAGAALVALGSFAKSKASSIGSGGGGYARGAGGYQSSRVDAPIQQGEFQYRDSYASIPKEIKLTATREGLGATLELYNNRRDRNV